MSLKTRFILLFIFSFLSGFSQNISISENTRFSVLTVDVSNEIHTLYGHTALRVKDSISNFDVVFNYGMFDFKTPNFALKFVKGDLQYFAAVYPYQDFEYSYKLENRSFYEQELHLTLQQKQLLFDNLNKSVFTEDRFYTYKFIDRNCTTKVIDVINTVLKNKMITNNLHKNDSYRTVLYEYQKDHFYLNLGINIIFGHRPDEEASKLFLPLDFMSVLKTAQNDKTSLSNEPVVVFKAIPVKNEFSFLDSIYSLILVLLAFVLVNKKWLMMTYFSIFGLIGLFFSLVGLYSLHREVLWNYNILLFNPLFLVLVYALIKGKIDWVKKVSLLCLLLLLVYVLYMLNKAHFVMVSPIIVATAIQLIKLYFQKSLLSSIKHYSA